MKNRLSLLLFFCTAYCNAKQKSDTLVLRPAIQKIVDSIAHFNVMDAPDVSIVGGKSPQWRRYENLSKLASTAELRQLTNDVNGVVRCYALDALVLRKDTSTFKIILNHLHDNEIFNRRYFDVGWSTSVVDHFLGVGDLDSIQRTCVDSILLYDKDIALQTKNELLLDLNVNFKYYDRIREIAIKEKNPVASVALARFKNKQDIPVIKRFLNKKSTAYYGIYAVREFPDTVFYPKLVKVFERKQNEKWSSFPEWRILFQALAKYPTPQTVELFERILAIKDNYDRNELQQGLMVALTKYPNPYFDTLKSKIHVPDYFMEEIKVDMDIEK